VYLEGDERPRRVERAEWGGRSLAIGLEGVADRDAAEALRGRYLEAEADPLPEGSYYWHQLEGLSVRDEGGRELGRLAEVFRAGEAEVYRIAGEGGPDLLIPALREVVLGIDLDRGEMIVRYEPEEVR
jgi:16S rRNA processing protein RimM